MNAAWIALSVLIIFIISYRLYARYLGHKVFEISDYVGHGPTPAHKYEDGIDYIPTKRSILFGHHFSSIAGAAPIIGPAVAIIWGWVPALIWIVLGVIFLGAAHDFGALVLSMKHGGKSIASVAEEVINTKVKKLFLVVVFFLVWIVIAVFTLVIANLFISFPGAVLPVNFEIIIAVLMGLFINKKKHSLTIPSILAQIGLFLMIYLGTKHPISLASYFGEHELMAWMIFLLIYSFIASCLPVTILLQPRDYINSHQLMLGLGLMIAGLFVVRPQIVAPALNLNPDGAPSWVPFLFITIACGAISGFHGLVSSGTTSKQVYSWKDSRSIGFGSMLGEGLLAVLATLAVATGFKNSAIWHQHYSSWDAANGLTAKINAFVSGASQFVSGLGINQEYSEIVIAVLIISFAATSLDTACRIQRYIIAELGQSYKIKILQNRFVGSSIAIGSAFALMMIKSGGKGGLLLWPLFGATNQMLAGLTLLIILVFLKKNKKNYKPYLIPTFFILGITSFALIENIKSHLKNENHFLMGLSIVLLILQFVIFKEGTSLMKKTSLTTND